MSEFAIIDPDGAVDNIVVADSPADVAVPDGWAVLPVDTNAMMGGTHDGAEFVAKPEPAPILRAEGNVLQALRDLAAEISPAAVALIEARFGVKP